MYEVTIVNNKIIGNLGEDIACKYLEGKGFIVKTRNYLKKWGEIDIVTHETNGKIHFVEVKTVSRENGRSTGNGLQSIRKGQYRAEDNVHPEKLRRMRRVIQSYLLEKGDNGYNWQFDVLTVTLNMRDKTAQCLLIDDVVL